MITLPSNGTEVRSLKSLELLPKDIADFVINNMPYLNDKREELIRAIEKHVEYKTCFITHDRNGIVSFSCWNVEGEVAHVLITCIKPSHRVKSFLKYLILSGVKMYPHLKFIRWEREVKTDKKFKSSVERLLRR